MVGVRLAPDGNNEEERLYLISVILNWIDKAKSHRLPRHLVWLSLTTGVMKKLCYPLPATTFTQAECYEIMSPLISAALPYIGVNRFFPRVMVHAPLAMQGLALPDIYVEQAIGHL